MSQRSRLDELLRDMGLPLEQQPRQLLTFDNPHSCEHCRDNVVLTGQEHTVIHCPCGWSGKGTVASPEYRACGSCGKLHDNEVRRRYSVTLQYGLRDAVAAARSGCLLYEYLVDSLGPSDDIITQIEDFFNLDTIESLVTVGKFHLSADITAPEGVPAGCAITSTLSTEQYSWTLSIGWLHIWAMPGDGASKFIDSRPYESNVDSDASWDFARRCLGTCLEKHGRCRERLTDASETRLRHVGEGLGSEEIDIANIPTRLLDVQAGTAGHIKLIKFDMLSDHEKAVLCSSGFAALSYCWGGQQSLTLTESQSQHLYGGFSSSELSKTLQDAVCVVRKLGLRYLWVDALCIQQDSDQDKAEEISRMASYYGSATVTICAAAAASSDQGFLFHRKSYPFDTGPFQLPLRNENGADEGHIYLLLEAQGSPEPTTTRGWTLQESLLSRRILIYSERQLYWSCSTSMCGCGGDIVALADKVSGSIESLVDNIYPIGASLQLPTSNQWQHLLMDYTTRHIGVPGDKLLAISALVSHIWDVSKERQEKPAYIAGLLVSLSNGISVLDQLRWHVLDPSRSRRASVYRAPSWSWAAIDGPIQNLVSRDDRLVPRQPDEAVVHNYSVDLVHQNLPFGSVSDAHMVIEAKMRPLCECINIADIQLIMGPEEWNPSNQSHCIYLLPDTKEDAQVIEEVMQMKDIPGGQISLLLLRVSRGLIISPTASGDMVRIGVFEIHEKKGLDESDREIVFKTCVPTSIRLV
ncbi:hypothetical protein N0V84_005319 [Fusarium piperis]|uniref:Heterokaryon incompatibility domain-containing protein n=1 Tax=Fusarium piperis TaxID=1435070 RepID=A0A9W8WE81_9HYPO|nr:hypothetical protein N0V84_005319 [Fusarium piperis]